MLLNPFRPCEGSPTFQEEYRGNYVPNFIDAWHGPQVVAPDTPYVAAAGPNKLYSIDTRFDPDTAKHIKEQIERATLVGPDEVISIDEISATAEVKNTVTGEAVFVFDPPYARVLFAKGINRRNPALKLPERQPAGDWLMTYDNRTTTTLTKRASCYFYGCSNAADYRRQAHGNCNVCHHYRVYNEGGQALTNAVGICRPLCVRPSGRRTKGRRRRGRQLLPTDGQLAQEIVERGGSGIGYAE